MKPSQCEVERFKKVEQSAPAAWVVQMQEHFAKTGTYRPEDLRRLLGDPNKAVQSGSKAGLSQYLSQT